ncbi:MAG: hypothetical protein ACREEB_14115 [Caulobacteraceae bacterium]
MNLLRHAWPALAIAAAACSPAPRASRPPAAMTSGAERDYAPPPAAVTAARMGGGRVQISGTAPPAARVRLASPSGQPLFTVSDAAGGWNLLLPPADSVRLFGLSAPVRGRIVQAEGYLAVTAGGEVAQLRAGSGAVVLGRTSDQVALLAADFDRKGGAVLSGRAPADAPVAITVDGDPRGPTKADPGGAFMLALNKPLAPGAHVIEVSAGGVRRAFPLTVSPAAPLTAGPFRADVVPDGWRIDWLTPGGGVQSTVLFGPTGARA